MLQIQGDLPSTTRSSVSTEVVAVKAPEAVEVAAVVAPTEPETAKVEDKPVDLTGISKWAWQQSRKEWPLVALACLGSITVAALWPANAVILSNAISVILAVRDKFIWSHLNFNFKYMLIYIMIFAFYFLTMKGADAGEVQYWCVAFIILAILNIVGNTMRVSFTFLSGESLTYNIRKRIFSSILHQRPVWFDDPRHGAAKIAQHLAADVPQVRNLVGDYINIVVLSLFILIGGLGVSLYYSWRVALVVLATIPCLVASGILMMKLAMSSSLESDVKNKLSAAHAAMLLSNIRLITSLGRAAQMIKEYKFLLDGPQAKLAKGNYKLCAAAFFSEFVKFGAFALAFFYGSVVVKDGDSTFADMFTALTGVMFCAIMAGIYGAQLPKADDAKLGAACTRELYNSLDEVSFICFTGVLIFSRNSRLPMHFHKRKLLTGISSLITWTLRILHAPTCKS
jgi:ABC-type multidrug transport system fused ATPase/permease subunit